MTLLKLTRISMAVTDMDKMVAFYNGVLEANLTAVPAFGDMGFYVGSILGIEVMMVPNGIAGVHAQQNRQQLRITVSNLDVIAQKVIDHGGSLQDDIQVTPEGKLAAAVDPDGNTIEFLEA